MRKLVIILAAVSLSLAGCVYHSRSGHTGGTFFGASQVADGSHYGSYSRSYNGWWPATTLHFSSSRHSGYGHHRYYGSRPYNGHYYNSRHAYRSGGYRGKYGGGHVYRGYSPKYGDGHHDRGYRGKSHGRGLPKSIHRGSSRSGGMSLSGRGGRGGCRGRC